MADQHNIFNAFSGILDNLVEGEKYDSLPPRGPVDSDPSISDRELEAQDQSEFGDDLRKKIEVDPTNKKTIPVEEHKSIEVDFPTEEELDGLNVIGIAGDNKRILTTSFHFILSRSVIVNFKYTKGFDKPYFYTKSRDASSLLVLDSNIFEEACNIHTYNDLIEKFDVPLLDYIGYKNSENKPFRFRYSHERSKKPPNSQSLGLAVKFQHALELLGIGDADFKQNGFTVCLKDGPLFSNSSALQDIGNGLKKLLSWPENRLFIAASTKTSESRVLINTLIEHPNLIESYFPDQGINPGMIESFGTDSLLLKKILKPGYRTPLIEYIEKTREGAISSAELKGLKPVTCFYHKRTKPYSFLRIELPKFMWEKNNKMAELAISVAIWQFELGGNQPLVIKTAKERSGLSHDKWVIEQQMKAAFDKKKLGLIEFLNFA